jgi:DUF4097 and DUF4098 domain-containing protein YvlB
MTIVPRPGPTSLAVSASVVVATTLLATSLPAQRPSERDIERTAERIGKVVEKTVGAALDQTARALEEAFGHVEGRGRYQQGGRSLDTTVAFSRTGTVDLSSASGDITVTGWNRAEVRIRATTERGMLRWRISESRLTLEPDGMLSRGGGRVEVSVPTGARVILRSTSGDLGVRGVSGAISASTMQGDIEVRDAGGRVDLSSLAGDIRLSGVRDDVEATSLSGSVEVEGAEARRIRIGSTSGDLVLHNVRSGDVSASTVSGNVEFSGAIQSGGQYEFTSHSGGITLTVPGDVSARLSVETFNGTLDSDFPVTLQPSRDRRAGRRLDFSLGGGSARIIAETFSGSVEIRRARR